MEYFQKTNQFSEVALKKDEGYQNETHPYRQSKAVKSRIAPLGWLDNSYFLV